MKCSCWLGTDATCGLTSEREACAVHGNNAPTTRPSALLTYAKQIVEGAKMSAADRLLLRQLSDMAWAQQRNPDFMLYARGALREAIDAVQDETYPRSA